MPTTDNDMTTYFDFKGLCSQSRSTIMPNGDWSMIIWIDNFHAFFTYSDSKRLTVWDKIVQDICKYKYYVD